MFVAISVEELQSNLVIIDLSISVLESSSGTGKLFYLVFCTHGEFP